MQSLTFEFSNLAESVERAFMRDKGKSEMNKCTENTQIIVLCMLLVVHST